MARCCGHSLSARFRNRYSRRANACACAGHHTCRLIICSQAAFLMTYAHYTEHTTRSVRSAIARMSYRMLA